MTAKGVRFLEAPRHEAYGTVAVFSDPYGNSWDLIQPRGLKSACKPLDCRRLAMHKPQR